MYFISVRGSSCLISSERCCFFSSLSEGSTLGSVCSRYEILYRLGYTELVSIATILNIRYRFRCEDMFCSLDANLLKCLWPNILGKDLKICSFLLLKLCISMVKFIKLSILSIVLWSEFCVLGYFTHSVYYAIVEALFVSKRKIKKVFFSVFGEIQLQNQSQWMMFCTLKPMLSVISNISRRFDTIWKYFLVFVPLLSGQDCLLQQREVWVIIPRKINFLISFASKFFNFIINDSIFEIVSIRYDSSSRIMLYCWSLHNYS